MIASILGAVDAERAHEALVRKYWRVVVGWVQPKVRNWRDAEEVAQDAFVKAFRSLARLESHRSFLAWLLQIAANQAKDLVRRRRDGVSLELLTDDGQVPETATLLGGASNEAVELELERRECLDAVLDTVNRLPEKYRLVVTLRYQLGLSAKEIAEQLGEPEGTIRNRVFRALEKIRGTLTDSAIESPPRRSQTETPETPEKPEKPRPEKPARVAARSKR